MQAICQFTGMLPGILYIILCAVSISGPGPLQAQDFLALAMAGQLLIWHRGELKNFLVRDARYLSVFILIAFLCSCFHVLQHTGGFYDFLVFSYMAFIYCYFRILTLSSRSKVILGGGLLAVFWGIWLAGLFLPGPFQQAVFYYNQDVSGMAGGVLSRRFAGFLVNPNLFGAFFPLPLLLLSGWWRERYSAGGLRVRVLLLSGALVICFPLFSSVSKHFVMSLAVILGSWLQVQKFPAAGRLFYCGWLAVIVAGLVCWCTVLVVTFPLKHQFPWVNTDAASNYSLHQEIYLKMASHDRTGLLTGRGPAEIRRLYPVYADRDKIAGCLKYYNSEYLIDTYSTFMDPHNEFLNQLSFFGIPGLAAMLLFLFALLESGRRQKNRIVFYYVTALLMCCLWDDILSKRYIWIELALAAEMLGCLDIRRLWR